MKRQIGKMLIQNMGLVPGERFMVGLGKHAFMAEYVGRTVKNGETYDTIKAVKS